MKPIPNEILGEIILHLNQTDMLECMLVCHGWKRIIEESYLFHTVVLNTPKGLAKLLNKIKEEAGISEKIKKLILNFSVDINEYYENQNALLSMLTSLQVLLLKDEHVCFFESEPIQYPWFHQIKFMALDCNTPVLHHLLESHMCSNLTEISLVGFGIDLPNLANAPNLETLLLTRGILDFEKLEFIHKSAPRLKSLTIALIEFDATTFGNDIEPATFISECVFSGVHVFELETSIQILDYISKKYPNTAKVEFSSEPDFGESGRNELTNRGWQPLMKKLGSQLKDLHIEGSVCGSNFFKMLDDNICRIISLQFSSPTPESIMNMAQSQQLRHLQQLYLDGEALYSFDWLKESPVLEHLTLYCGSSVDASYTVNLNDIIEKCPAALKYLSLGAMNVSFDFNSSISCQIETLSLVNMRLHEKMEAFILKYIPRLSNITFSSCNLTKRIFDLATLDLNVVSVSQYGEAKAGVLVVTVKDDKKRFDQLNTSFPRMLIDESKMDEIMKYPAVRTQLVLQCPKTVANPVKQEDEEDTQFAAGSYASTPFTLICNSFNNLVFTQ